MSPDIDLDPDRPRVFIGASGEALEIANAIGHYIDLEARPVVWRGAFNLSKTTIEELERNLQASDFGVLVLSGDDHRASRGDEAEVPRDNVVFELGMSACSSATSVAPALLSWRREVRR